MTLDLVLAILAGIALVTGFLGCLLPVIPGPPLAWAGLLVAHFSSYCVISIRTLIICAVFTVLVTVIDSIAPVWFTKRSGGTKFGSRGAIAGLIIGLFMGPIGIIIGPFAGAFIGELINDNKNTQKAFKAALSTFIGFLCGTGMKMITCGVFIWIYIRSF